MSSYPPLLLPLHDILSAGRNTKKNRGVVVIPQSPTRRALHARMPCSHKRVLSRSDHANAAPCHSFVLGLFGNLIDGCGLVAVGRAFALACAFALGQDTAARGVHALDSLALFDFGHGCDVVLGVLEGGLGFYIC
jgi:hypothetical protein